MTTDPSRQIWKAGVALSDAWLHFAEQAVREEHESKPGFTGTLQHLVAVAQSTRDGKKILSALQEVGKAHLDKLESRKLLQDMLIEVLATDHLIATGYAGKDKKAAPVPIDPSFFAEASADWDNSVVRLNGTTYERVRITDPAAIPAAAARPVLELATIAEAEPVAETPPAAKVEKPAAKVEKKAKPSKPKAKVKAKKPPVPPSKPVQPSKKAAEKPAKAKRKAKVETPSPAPVPVVEAVAAVSSAPASAARSKVSEGIHAALEKLVASEAGFADLNRRSAAQKIRDELHAAYEKGNGLSDPNLARYIRKKCGLKTVKH
ncbi:hypothetical protein [Sphingobium phenoxybenzoativorans]|uniref:hypothetical protein n=1 Tax=Sphingobium phenoxybenzoativorans TaxID=1592790 RepID=UPI0008724744|nr:hypothetical protein [Sphingobium phenoxybenzoativorans]